nr:immunoglobulin heavy chain junction region [Mus musculus]MBK4190037.1 immunoglobulin heavy chain junction region [Mus musculus]MBK4190038.1 immunoglobulin heavy chain junction region [Mus musculus]MBK4190039.1 immunoglobulin heavy chain junction region [Mus musculus]
CARSWDWFAYW